jgi:hypothetical protein
VISFCVIHYYLLGLVVLLGMMARGTDFQFAILSIHFSISDLIM